jgi:hypothetical protein
VRQLNLLFSLLLCLGLILPGHAQDEEMLERELEQARQQAEQLLQNAQDPKKFNIDQIFEAYRNLDPKETKAHLEEQLRGKPFVNDPRIVNFLDEVLRHPHIMKDLLRIVENRSKLGLFVACNIFLFILFWWLKKRRHRRTKKPHNGIITRLILWSAGLVFRIGVRVALMAAFYYAELKNFAAVFSKHFL